MAMELAHLRRVGLSIPERPACELQLRQAGRAVAAVAAAPAPAAAGPSVPICRPCAGEHGPVNLLGCCGFAPVLVERPKRAAWLQPSGGRDVGLMTTNTLTGEKEKFVPLEGNKIRWYMCGPTVYDVSHCGHARAYLTFDIIRRIMMNYFKFDVAYQINITDIDDKIILRSRQNKLLDDFRKEADKMDAKTLAKTVDEAVAAFGKKLRAKEPEKPPASAPEKDKQEYEKLMPEHQLKLGQHAELEQKVAAAKKGSKEELLSAAKDPLMAKLDKEKGHTITDHSIFNAHARRFEDDYFRDMDALGVLRPDVVTRISDYMDGRVQDYIAKLVDTGFCYDSNGSVYFSIDDFAKEGYNYRKLVPAAAASAAEMAEGEGALADEAVEKRNANDFAVWKKSKPGEPAWESPWGPGRPGWHIECSVMACHINKEFLDIHSGGEDLKFPHHDNEIAQSEAYLGRPQWSNYWWHAGHLSIEGLKMSKSLKNFITIQQALQNNSARQMRLMFLMQAWDKGMNYSDQAIAMAKAEERKFKHFLGILRFYQRHPHGQKPEVEKDAALEASVVACEQAIGDALRDNFSTPKVIEAVSKLVMECYSTFESLPAASLAPVQKAAELVERILGILGVEGLRLEREKEAAWTAALDAFAQLRQDVRRLAGEKAGKDEILKAVKGAEKAAEVAKKAGLSECASTFASFLSDLKDLSKESKPADLLKRCDEVRDKNFVALGVRLEDLGAANAGFIWMFEEADVLLREQAEKAERAAEAALAKLENKRKTKEQEIKAAEKAAIAPKEWFKAGANKGLYSDFDDSGLPGKLSGGEELSAKKKKDLAKELAKQQKEFEKLSKQASGDIDAYMAKLKKELKDLS